MIPFLVTLYRFGNGIVKSLKDPEFEALLTLVVITLLSGTIFYHGVEGWSYLDSLYFCVVTLTTVGYGDLYPHTALGKIFTIVYLFVGIGVLLGFINTVAHHAVEDSKNSSLLPKRFRFRHKAIPSVTPEGDFVEEAELVPEQ